MYHILALEHGLQKARPPVRTVALPNSIGLSDVAKAIAAEIEYEKAAVEGDDPAREENDRLSNALMVRSVQERLFVVADLIHSLRN